MESFSFFETEDKSTGLYSNVIGDIFHSRTGALKEANEKFIYRYECAPGSLDGAGWLPGGGNNNGYEWQY